jgi:integrase/recombinase XerD
MAKKKSTEISLGYDHSLAKKFEKAAKRKVSINDFMQDFIGQFISEQTQKAYLTDLKFFFDFMKSGNVSITHPNQIQGHHFQYYRDKLISDNYSSATINRKLVAIRSFIKWAMASKLIDYNPLDIVKLPKVQTETPTLAFDDAEVIEMINSPDLTTKKGQMNRVAMILLFSLGLRRSELVNIKLGHLYKERHHNVLKIKGKGDKDRHLPISNSIAGEISHYIEALSKLGLNLEKQDYLLQSNKNGKNTKPVDGSTIYRMINKYAKKCGIDKKVSPHSCRATAISHLLDTQKTPIRDVAIFAGHSKITTTERYDKRRENLDNSAAYDVDYVQKKKA